MTTLPTHLTGCEDAKCAPAGRSAVPLPAITAKPITPTTTSNTVASVPQPALSKSRAPPSSPLTVVVGPPHRPHISTASLTSLSSSESARLRGTPPQRRAEKEEEANRHHHQHTTDSAAAAADTPSRGRQGSGRVRTSTRRSLVSAMAASTPATTTTTVLQPLRHQTISTPTTRTAINNSNAIFGAAAATPSSSSLSLMSLSASWGATPMFISQPPSTPCINANGRPRLRPPSHPPLPQPPQQKEPPKQKTATPAPASIATDDKTSAAATSPSVAQLLRAFLAEHAPAPPAPHADHTSTTTNAEAQTCLTQVEMEQLYAMLRDQHPTPPPPPTTTTTATPTTNADAPTSPSISILPLPQWVVDDSDEEVQLDATSTRVFPTTTATTVTPESVPLTHEAGTTSAPAKSATSTNVSITVASATEPATQRRRSHFPAVLFVGTDLHDDAPKQSMKKEEDEEDGDRAEVVSSDAHTHGVSASSHCTSTRPSFASSGSDDDRSVERRYTQALKILEEATTDCEVALQRIEDYAETLYVLVETWMHLHDNRFEEFAHAVLQRLLEIHPSCRVLFHDIDVPRQALVIMDMIGRAVVAFTRPADLMDIMGEMGARHNLYGLHTEDFAAMRTAFLQVYGEFVGPETYAKSVGVWKMFWKTTIEFAGSGAKSERGKVYTERRYRIWAEQVKKVVRHLLPRQRSGGFHRLMQLTYQRACEQHPRAMQPYHQLADLRTAHRTMEAFMRIVKRVVYAETAPVVGYNEQFSIDHLLTDLASAVAPHDVALMADAFLDACESYTQPALWDEVVRAALRELWLVYVVGYWTARRERVADGAAQEAAPSGREPFCLLFTDIEASTRLWDADPRAMGAAISRHHQVVRGLIEDFGGYEVKTVGDSFLVATNTVTQALLIAFGIQLELMTEPSAPGFRMVDSPQGGGDASCWRGDALRVRVGIHYCTDASAVYDSVHGRFDYYGPSVNCASRVESSACGGQVLLSEDAYAHLRQEDAFAALPANRLYVEQVGKLVRAQEARGVAVARDPQLSWIVEAVERDRAAKTVRRASSSAHAAAASLRSTHVHSAQLQRRNSRGEVMTLQSLTTATDEGLHPLKGIAEPVRLFSLLPLGLTGREFPQMRRANPGDSDIEAMISITAMLSWTTAGISEGSVNGSDYKATKLLN